MASVAPVVSVAARHRRSDKPVVAFAKRKVKQKGKRNMRKKGSEEVQVGEQRS